MLILCGETGSKRVVRRLQNRGWGRMFVERIRVRYPGEPWAFDNGAFANWRRGREFNEEKYLRRLERAMLEDEPPEFAVCPDLPCAPDSLEFSLRWRERLPDSIPWALALQNGMSEADVRSVAHRFSVLFLGGDKAFKFSTAQAWCELARGLGLKFHYARAGTERAFLHALRVGADSCDSSLMLWSLEKFNRFESFTYLYENQLSFWEGD